MLHQFRTLRFRLTFLFVLIFGAIQLTLWLVVDLVLSGYMLSRFDDALVDRARSIAEAIEAEAPELPTDAPGPALRRMLTPFAAPDRFIQVRHSNGDTIFRSHNLLGVDFPLPNPTTGNGRAPEFRILSGELVETLRLQGGRLRLMTMSVQLARQEPIYVQVGADLAPIDRVTAELHRLLALFIFVSLVVAGVTAWYMTRRYLRPIGVIARRAREISASHLDERLPVPTEHSEITDMVHVINEMLERLESEFTNQQRFIADASHELKTPLAVLMGEAHSLRRHAHLSRETAAFVATVEEETRQLLRTVEGFLILSRYLSGRRPSFPGEVSVEEAVLKAIERCRRFATGQNVRIVPTFDVRDEADEPHVNGDADLLRSMVENLLRNGIRYSPEGESIEVHVTADSDTVEIRVRDHGPGIPPDKLRHVFDPFYQAAPGGSAGIGLSIVRAVAEMHGGDVSAGNGRNGGSEFVVRLPTERGEAA